MGLSHRSPHQSLIAGVKWTKLTSTNVTVQNVPKITIRMLDFDVDLEIQMCLLYLFLLKVI